MNLIVFPPGRSWRFLLRSQTELFQLSDSRHELPDVFVGAQHIDGPGLTVFLQHFQDFPKIPGSEIPDPVFKLRIELCFHPGQIFPLVANPLFGLPETDIRREIQQDHCVAGIESGSQSPSVIAVHDPGIGFKDGVQFPVEQVRVDVGTIGTMPDLIKINQRQVQTIPQLPAEGALPLPAQPITRIRFIPLPSLSG